MSNTCSCGGYLRAEEYESRAIQNYILKNPEDKEEIEEYLAITGKTKREVWFVLCDDCQSLRIRTRSNFDGILDRYRSRDTY